MGGLGSLFEVLTDHGVLGVVMVLAIIALIKRDLDLTKERRERLNDAKTFATIIQANTQAQKDMSAAMSENAKVVTRAAEGIARISGQVAHLDGGR